MRPDLISASSHNVNHHINKLLLLLLLIIRIPIMRIMMIIIELIISQRFAPDNGFGDVLLTASKLYTPPADSFEQLAKRIDNPADYLAGERIPPAP